jgi:hypothetical protein
MFHHQSFSGQDFGKYLFHEGFVAENSFIESLDGNFPGAGL